MSPSACSVICVSTSSVTFTLSCCAIERSRPSVAVGGRGLKWNLAQREVIGGMSRET